MEMRNFIVEIHPDGHVTCREYEEPSNALKSLVKAVIETASLFRDCDGYSQGAILREECAELIVGLSHLERNRNGSLEEIYEELSHVLISCFAYITCADIPVEDLIAEVSKKYNKYKEL